MTCIPFSDGKGKGGFVCYPNIYKMEREGKTYLFEWHSYLGPMELKDEGNYEERETNQAGFFELMDEFRYLTKKQREKYWHREHETIMPPSVKPDDTND